MKSIDNSGREGVDAEEKMLIEAVRNYFRFLVEQYRLNYRHTHERSFGFASSAVRIELEVGHKSPRILIYRIAEDIYPIMINWFLAKPRNFSPGSLYNPN